MVWDIFRKDEKASGIQDEIEMMIRKIERFSPRRFKHERESYFYNYKILNQYVQPLLGLLIIISERKRVQSNEFDFIRRLFLKLKDFYDVRNKLSIDQAIADMSLKRKLKDLMLFFYENEKITMKDIDMALDINMLRRY